MVLQPEDINDDIRLNDAVASEVNETHSSVGGDQEEEVVEEPVTQPIVTCASPVTK